MQIKILFVDNDKYQDRIVTVDTDDKKQATMSVVSEMSLDEIKYLLSFEFITEQPEQAPKGKLTAAQARIMESIKAANYRYRDLDNHIFINSYLYIDGVHQGGNNAYCTESGAYRVQLNTRTLDALIDKGYVLPVESIAGSGYDTIETVDEYEKPKLYRRFLRIELVQEGTNARRTLYCPNGQSEMTTASAGYDMTIWRVSNSTIVPVVTWN